MNSTPSSPGGSCMFFVGQGAQTVGMTRDVLDMTAVQTMYSQARDILGYDLQQIVLEGPASRLDDTAVAQPALLVAGLAAYEKLLRDDPAAISQCTAMAGLSLGEYSALVASGALAFTDAMRLVKVRGEAMNVAAAKYPGKMLTVIGLDEEALAAACAQIATQTQQHLQICNFLFPKGCAVGGLRVRRRCPAADKPQCVAQGPHCEGIYRRDTCPLLLTSDAQMKELQVAGAFHTPLMASACAPLKSALENVTLSMPRVPVYSNVTGQPFASVNEIRESLVQQIVQPVRWLASVRAMLQVQDTAPGTAPVPRSFDLGPRGTIKAMLRRTNMPAWKQCTAIDV